MVVINSLDRLEGLHTEIREGIKSVRSQVDNVSIMDDFEIDAQKKRELLEKTIDDVATESTNHLLKLKARLNALAPINKIPQEILCLIILLTGKPTIENRAYYFPYTWVCHRWRSILIDDPRFWTFICHACHGRRHGTFGYIKCPEELHYELVRRSKSSKLDVVLFRSFKECETRITLIASESDRIRTLCVDEPSLTHLDISKSFSSLRCFISEGSYRGGYTVNPCPDLLPFFAACKNLEVLQFLVAENMRTDQLAHIFERLKGLTLLFDAQSPQFVDSVLVLLHNNRNLRNLRIESADSVWCTLDSLISPRDIIMLPELQVLESHYPFVLESIRAPKVSYLDISSRFWSSTRGHPLIDTFDFSSILHLYIKKGDLTFGTHDCISGSAELPKCPDRRQFLDDPPDSSKRYFHIDFHIENHRYPRGELQPLLSIILPPSVNLIELHLLISCKYYDLEEVLVSAPALQQLVINEGGRLLDFIILLRNTSILTQLKTLFHLSTSTESSSKLETYADMIGEALVTCLRSRKKDSVHELRSIELHRCPALRPALLKELIELGTEVVTDDYKGGDWWQTL